MNPRLSRRQVIGMAATVPLCLPGLAAAAGRAAIPAADPAGIPAGPSGRAIDEQGFVRIGGIEQWIAIQGRDTANPAIVYLHGGPAEAQSPFLREFLPWEQDFTVVNWDQRGSGKTYGRNGPSTPGMSTPAAALERLVEDARDVAGHVRRRLSKRKVILVGQSWGALLGVHVIKRWPELFHAFVGTGQPVSWMLSLQDQERWARRQAAAAGDQDTLKALDETASLPVSDIRRITAVNKYRMSAPDLEYLQIQRTFLGAPPLPKHGDVADWVDGGTFTTSRLLPLIFSFDLRRLGLNIPVPFFVIQGRDDHVVSFDAAKAYVAEVHAPRKAFIPIDGGHFACFTDPAQFVDALRRSVRPLAPT